MSDIFRLGATRHRNCTVTTVREDEPIVFTFAETADRVNRLGQALAAAGVRRGDVLASFCRNHHEQLELLFASHLLGTCFAPLNTRSDDGVLRAALERAAPRVMVADASGASRLDALLSGVDLRISVGAVDGWETYEDLLDSAAATNPLADAEADESARAALLFTGGTTGTPKGATYSQRALYLHTLAMATKLGAPLAPGDIALLLVPFNHGLGWQQPHLCWFLGASIAFIDGSLPGSAVAAGLEATGATVSSAVPTVWHDVAGYAEAGGLERLGELRTVMLGGAMTPPPLPARLTRLGVTVYVGWGMTETLPSTMTMVASADPSAPVQPDVRTSTPLPGAEFRALDDAGQPTSGPGTIEIRAPWITGEYLGGDRPNGPWFDTGDVGTVAESGEFTIIGRAKEMIKSGGEQIWPSTIEAALLEHPGVLEVAVIEIPHERYGGQPLACVVPSGAVTPTELRSFLLGSLPKWQVPVAWALDSSMPHTAVGKIDKRALVSMVADASLVPVFVR